MTQSNSSNAAQPQRNIISRPVGEDTVLTLIGAGAGGRGPWPFVTGIPNLSSDISGPPPQYLAVAGWAA